MNKEDHSKQNIEQISLNGIDPDTVFHPSPPSSLPGPQKCPECRHNLLRKNEKECSACRLSLILENLISTKKLNEKAWQQFQFVFALPDELNQTPVKRACFLRHLLEFFTARRSYENQVFSSNYQFMIWLDKNLPKNFKKQFHLYKAVQFLPVTNEDFEISESSLLEDQTKQQEINSNRKTSRRTVSSIKFAEVAARQGSFCFWCGGKVIKEADIPAENRLIKNKQTVVYLAGDQLREEAIGTIDHLLRLRDGGSNNPENLVISCLSCNSERDRVTQAYNRPFARRKLPCKTCGGRFFHPDWGCCSICGDIPLRKGFIRKLINFIIGKIK